MKHKTVDTQMLDTQALDTQALRRSLHSADHYYRKGLGHERAATNMLATEYQSPLMDQIRENNYVFQRGDVTIRLAEAFGFCWGVERAIALTYEARQQFPHEKIWITNELIHNPLVNDKLRKMDIEFIAVDAQGKKDFSVVASEDVVVFPAFGASAQELALLSKRGCKIMDTTCPWVSKVWNSVEKHKKKEYTSIIHGKYGHEETVATKSYAGAYLIVLDLQQAEYVCDYIIHGGNREDFLTKFANAHSPGFDPDTDLVKIGIANQTTMLKGETEQIGKLFEYTLMRKYGPAALNHHLLTFNTICNATQERQDAILTLLKGQASGGQASGNNTDKPALDFMLVVGGFNSSNTTHLHEMALKQGVASYHVDSEDCLGPGNQIKHKKLHQDITVIEEWLPAGPVVVGVTSGASTPDKVVANAIQKIFTIKAAMLSP